MESGLAVSLKQWKYPKVGSTLKKSKLCFRCLGEGHSGQSCFRMRVCGLDDCTEVHHRLLHKQAVNKNKTGNKIQVMQQIYINNKQVVMLIMVYLNSKNMCLMLIKVLKQQVLSVRERLLIEMKMPQ